MKPTLPYTTTTMTTTTAHANCPTAQANPATWKGHDPLKTPMSDIFKEFGLDSNTADFTGHALALYRDDEYLKLPYLETIK